MLRTGCGQVADRLRMSVLELLLCCRGVARCCFKRSTLELVKVACLQRKDLITILTDSYNEILQKANSSLIKKQFNFLITHSTSPCFPACSYWVGEGRRFLFLAFRMLRVLSG